MSPTLAQLQEETVRYFMRTAPEALASDALVSLYQLCQRRPLNGAPSERVAALAGLLTTLLWAANETGLCEFRAYKCQRQNAAHALVNLRREAQGNADADGVARCFAEYWELLRCSGFWVGQVKTVAWRRLREKVVQ